MKMAHSDDASDLISAFSQPAQSEYDMDESSLGASQYHADQFHENHQQIPPHSPSHPYSIVQETFNLEQGPTSPSATLIGSGSSNFVQMTRTTMFLPQSSFPQAASTHEPLTHYGHSPRERPGYQASSRSEHSLSQLSCSPATFHTPSHQHIWGSAEAPAQNESTNQVFKNLGSIFDSNSHSQIDTLKGPTTDEILVPISSSNSVSENGQVRYVNEAQGSRLGPMRNIHFSPSQRDFQVYAVAPLQDIAQRSISEVSNDDRVACNYASNGCPRDGIEKSLKRNSLKKHLEVCKFNIKGTSESGPRQNRKSCDMCEESFTLSKDLKRHRAAIHAGASFNCIMCPSQFNRSDNLVRHCRNVHHVAPSCSVSTE